MASRSSSLYMQRKKLVPEEKYPVRPRISTDSISTHNGPHEVLPELRTTESPCTRAEAVKPLGETLGNVDREIQTS
jgi:hypothetical protein